MINVTIKKSDLILQTKILGICLGTLFVFNHFGDFNYMSEMDEYERGRWRTHIESNRTDLSYNSMSSDEENYQPTEKELDFSTPEGKLYRLRQVPKNTPSTGETRIAEPFVSDSRHRIVNYISYKPIIGFQVSTEVITGLKEYDILYIDSKFSEFTYPKRLILYIKSTLVNFYLSIVLLIIYNLFIKLKKNIRVKIE